MSHAPCTAEGLEEALRASLDHEGAMHGPPPAAKAAVKALVRERLTADRLAQLGWGEGVQCSVCRCMPRQAPSQLLFKTSQGTCGWTMLHDAFGACLVLNTSCCCREELAVGDEVQLMPCNEHHVYHPPCLAPWLQQHNSCPVCRHELPTDDQKYETRKQRAAAQAEELRGAQNALTHNEFMYT
jgi:E3 ubiquitin-protein ligase AIP2